VQSIEHTLRALDKFAVQEEERKDRLEKALSDYRAQANRPFEHESRLKDLLARQAQLNAALDLDKGERQAAEPAEDDIGPAGDVLPGPSIPQRAKQRTLEAISRAVRLRHHRIPN